MLRCMFKPACARQWDFAEESDLKLGDLERDGGAFPAFPDGREIHAFEFKAILTMMVAATRWIPTVTIDYNSSPATLAG